MNSKYKNPDNDATLWRTDNAFASGAATHQGMVCAIQHPFTGKMLYPSNGACWRYQQDTMLEIASGQAQKVYDRGQWPRFYFTKSGKGGIARKTYLDNVGGKLPTNFWPFKETGHTDEAKKEMLSIFDGRATFDTPKPSRLIEFILRIVGNSGVSG